MYLISHCYCALVSFSIKLKNSQAHHYFLSGGVDLGFWVGLGFGLAYGADLRIKNKFALFSHELYNSVNMACALEIHFIWKDTQM